MNKRVQLPGYGTPTGSSVANGVVRETALTNKKGEDVGQLDEYFPFDPYQLPRSKRWVEGDYRVWKGVPGLDDVDDKNGDSSSDSDSDSESNESESDSEDDSDGDEVEETDDKISVSS